MSGLHNGNHLFADELVHLCFIFGQLQFLAVFELCQDFSPLAVHYNLAAILYIIIGSFSKSRMLRFKYANISYFTIKVKRDSILKFLIYRTMISESEMCGHFIHTVEPVIVCSAFATIWEVSVGNLFKLFVYISCHVVVDNGICHYWLPFIGRRRWVLLVLIGNGSFEMQIMLKVILKNMGLSIELDTNVVVASRNVPNC